MLSLHLGPAPKSPFTGRGLRELRQLLLGLPRQGAVRHCHCVADLSRALGCLCYVKGVVGALRGLVPIPFGAPRSVDLFGVNALDCHGDASLEWRDVIGQHKFDRSVRRDVAVDAGGDGLGCLGDVSGDSEEVDR